MIPPKDPTNYAAFTYVWVLGLSIWGGVVSFMQKVKRGRAHVFNLMEFIGEIVTSAFAGILTFWLCQEAGFDGIISAALVGISGHMGSRIISMIEFYLTKRYIGVEFEERRKNVDD
jgi:uncharacterized membrane protein YeaQ/YmgE (transglycosylase-associated protein family)